MPGVSVIISVYNGFDYLKRCVHSILAQTYTDWECLIVDDGSPDGKTPALCNEIEGWDSRIRVFHKENGGADSGWRYAIERAGGKWLFFIDQDDLFSPVSLESALQIAEKNPFSMVQWMWTEDQEHLPTSLSETGQFIRRPFSDIASLYMESHLYFTWSRMFQRDILLKHKVMPPAGITYGGDMMFCIEYIYACIAEGYRDILLLKSPLYYYETGNSQSVTTHFRTTYCDDELKTTDYLLSCFHDALAIDENGRNNILRSCMRTMAEGICYVNCVESDGSAVQQHEKALQYLRSDIMQKLLECFQRAGLYSPYCFFLRHEMLHFACRVYRCKLNNTRLYNRLYWIGYWLHFAFTRKKDTPYI